MLLNILRNAYRFEITEARHFTANNLHVPWEDVSDIVAVGYVVRHFHSGQLEGWDGFCEALR